jgi:hypothetical protein
MLPTEPWMRRADCRSHPQLPWIRDPEDVRLAEEARMAVVCLRCSMFTACRRYAEREGVTSGYWAGEFRDPPLGAIGGAA